MQSNSCNLSFSFLYIMDSSLIIYFLVYVKLYVFLFVDARELSLFFIIVE